MSSSDAKEQPSEANISNLEESFSAQQKKISALKELVRKSEVAHGKSTSSAQEKVRNIEQRLTHLKSKARSRQSLDTAQPDAMTEAEAETEAKTSNSFLQLSIDTPNTTPLKAQQQKQQQDQQQQLRTSTSHSTMPVNATASSAGTPGSEKILLLRQQMEQNKMRMAQRASSKLHLEQLVTQLKEKFGSTQQLCLDASDLGKSMSDLSALSIADAVAYTSASTSTATPRERHKSATDLSLQPFSLERERMKFLENRCRLLEKQLEKERQGNSTAQQQQLNESTPSQATEKHIKELENKVLELEESLVEQRQQASNAETSPENQPNSLSIEIEAVRQENAAKEAELSELRLKLEEYELSVVAATSPTTEDTEYNAIALKNENERLHRRIAELEEVNDVLETTRYDLTEKNREYQDQLKELKAQLNTAYEQMRQTESNSASLHVLVEKLQNSTEAVIVEQSSSSDTDSKITTEMAKQIQQLLEESQMLRDENSQLRESINEHGKLEVSDESIADKIAALESTIESQRDDLQQRNLAINKHEEQLMEKTIELNVLNANFKVLEEKLQATSKTKSLFSTSGYAEDAENPEQQAKIRELKQKLDDSNKAMIKLKLKCKQSEKQMEKLRKSSDLHAEVVRLERVNETLQQKVIELEDEKGQWQLTQVEDNNVKTIVGDAEMVNKCQTQMETIRLLEQQKYEQSERLESALQELQTLQQLHQQSEDSEATARVKSEMSEIQLEEQLGELQNQLTSLRQDVASKDGQVEELQRQLKDLQSQKTAADKKLDLYISENMELLDKVEKLSKSSSSAESIEIVERLTRQERAEIDAYNKRLEPNDQNNAAAAAASSVSELTQTEMGQELSESLAQLREESSELMNKVELFTTERREVLEKMENLTAENHELIRKIEELSAEKEHTESDLLLADSSKSKLQVELQQLTKEKERLALQVAESNKHKDKLSHELTSLQHSSEVVASLDSVEGATLFDKCEKSLTKLNSELEAYRRANDKNAKFNASKKLAKEAKNAHAQLSELLMKVKESSNAVETVTVVETVVAVTAPNGKALAEYEQLTAQNRELKITVNELRRELQEARETSVVLLESTANSSDRPAITQEDVPAAPVESEEPQLKQALAEINKCEEQYNELQSTVEDLRQQLQDACAAGDEKSERISLLSEELVALQKMSDDFDRLINEKEMSFEKQIEQLTRLRRELEGKCETYEGEIEILQTLVTEQKQQLIEAYKESEHEINLKLLDLQQRDEQISQLRAEICTLKATSVAVGQELKSDLKKECDKLHESLKIKKTLVAEQENELGNKQDTIDTLNQQIIDLYKTMEENSNNIIEKEDEMTNLQELLDTNNKELERLRKDNNEQKSVVDKLLNELHSHRVNMQHLPQLECELQRAEQAKTELEALNKELETRNKSQLEKLKKYAANLKKRSTQCQELESKIHELEKGALEAFESKEHKDDSKDAQLQDLTAINLQLNERINDLELKLKETEFASKEHNDALQAKTVEFLETMERNSSLVVELKQSQDNLEKLTQETVQLQNALAASSDWGDVAVSDDSITKELTEKIAVIAKLEEDLKCANENLMLKSQEIFNLHTKLNFVQDEVSDWEDASVEKHNNEKLARELSEQTANLEQSEQAISNLNAELLKMHENQKTWQEAERELLASLQQENKLTQELKKQIENMNDNQNITQKLQDKVQAQEQRLAEIGEELRLKSLKFEKSKAVIKERNNQIQRLQAQITDLHQTLSSQPEEEHLEPALVQSQLNASAVAVHPLLEEHNALKSAYEKLHEQYSTEKSNFQDTIARLETLHNGIQAKLQEDNGYIESLEQENAKFKDKICKLEDGVACFEERRASMERRANLLDAQMQTRANEYEKTEDELVYRLNMLSEHDDVIAQRLLNSQEEKEELQERLDRLQLEVKNLNTKYSKLEKEHKEYQENITLNAETEQKSLSDKLKASDVEIQRLRSVYDAKLAAKTTEVDELECELSDQLEKINAEKRALSEKLEKSCDECAVQKDEIVRLRESLNALEQTKHELEREATWLRMQNENSQQDQYEAQELRMQTMQDKTEIENLRHQIETLAANHEIELQALRTQICELDTLRMQVGQNQTDDQVFIETENKRLTDLLAEKEAVIENCQRQNLQLQMASAASTVSAHSHQQLAVHADPIALAFGLPPTNVAQSQTLNDEIEHRLHHDLAERTEMTQRLQHDLNALQIEFQSLVEGNREMQRQLLEKNREIENLKVRSLPSQGDSDVIPAPPMFFASEQTAPSPFDELVQIRTVEHALEGAAVSRRLDNYQDNSIAAEQPTIEDLQRNVSDLEKHAQDLENKLAVRNQREGEHEERVREVQARLQETENHIREQNQQLQQAQLELQNQIKQGEVKEQHLVATRLRVEELSRQLEVATQLLKERDEQWRDFESKNNVQHLKTLLEQRENEISHLKHTIEEEKHLKETASSLENQILIIPNTQSRTDDTTVETIRPTLDMFFGSSPASEFEKLFIPQVSDEPVVEEMIVPKKTYVCQPKERSENNAILTALDLGDDWGDDTWDSKEAAAEAAHIASTSAATHDINRQSLVPRERQLEIQLQEESERIQELQLALERCEQQKQEMQVKSGKMLKKLKEYKIKIDDLNASASVNVFRKSASVESNSMFGDLDAAIQEELKTQIQKLEVKLGEEHKIQETYLTEKEKLLKRIDVLTAGNERMSEMKERQDMDMQMYQVRIRELQEKLSRLDDWGTDSAEQEHLVIQETVTQLNAPPTITRDQQETLSESLKLQLEQKIVRLTAEFDDVNGDRQELQALLDDEKSNVVRAEEAIRILQQQISSTASNESSEKSKYNELKLELQNLQELYNTLYDTNGKLVAELKNARAENLQKLQSQESTLTAGLQTASAEILALQNEVQLLRDAARIAEEENNELQSEMLVLKSKNHELMQATEELQSSGDAASAVANRQDSSKQNEQWQLERGSLVKQISDLQLEISDLQSLPADSSDELLAQLQERESEILHLKQRIEDLMHEDQTEKLVLEILTKNQEIHMLKMQAKHLEDDKHELEHSLSQTKTQLVQNDEQLSPSTQLQEQVKRLEVQVAELQDEKANMEEELKVLNNHVLGSLQLEDQMKATALELDVKTIEIAELRKTIEMTSKNSSESTAGSAKEPEVDFVALNAQWELIVEQKCGEIAQMWREHLEQRERDFKITELRLHEQITALQMEMANGGATMLQQQHQQQQGISAETTATSTPVSESTVDSASGSSSPSKVGGTPLRTRIINEDKEDEANEADVIIEKMQTALESQEMEIVTLKEQLAIRSAEYARLAAQYDPFKLQTTLSHSGHVSATVAGGGGPLSLDSSNRRNASTGEVSVVPKSELDLAMYMLHQRDMRCEEMTLELVSLLGERDTLQLKLSNTLRQVEAIRVQNSSAEPVSTQADTAAATSADSPIKTSVAGSTVRQDDSDDDLTHKLSQLQTVKHSRDKVIKEERESRNRQMEKIQQDVANIPQDAVSELVGTDISQSSQSPSSVLLNWLWGNKHADGTAPN